VQRLSVWAPEDGERTLFMYVTIVINERLCPDDAMQNLFAVTCVPLAGGDPGQLDNDNVSSRSDKCTGITIVLNPPLSLNICQLFVLYQWFYRLLKDKELLAGEVMHEYDEKVRELWFWST
jgi:Protein of unknown function (DUF2418)